MVFVVIAGLKGCSDYCHVCLVADYLEKELPNFRTKRVLLDLKDWQEFLVQHNKANNWHHATSPLIYKQLLGYGGTRYLIGGISEFWEYCYKYYGVQSFLSPSELENLTNQQKNEEIGMKARAEVQPTKLKNIVIYCDQSDEDFLWLMVQEILNCEELGVSRETTIKIYQDAAEVDRLSDDERLFFDCKITYVEKLAPHMKNCDLFIIMSSFEASDQKGLVKTIIKANTIANQLSLCPIYNVRVCFASFGLSCLAATLIMDKLDYLNFVVVTSDRGLSVLNTVSQTTGLKLENLGAPPVWGFVGLNEIVDVGSIVAKCNVRKPYERAIRTKNSTLLLGTVATEFRWINYVADDNPALNKQLERRKMETDDRRNVYAKVRATISVLRQWYTVDSDAVISAGVLSDGSYEIPIGVVFSQPVVLNDGIWVPLSNFPITPQLQQEIERASNETLLFLDECKVPPEQQLEHS